MPINSKYIRPKIVAGDLNTPVTFFEFKPSNGPEPGDEKKETLYDCTALVYDPSIKDRDLLNGIGTKEAVTIKIRDPFTDYLPSNKHKAQLDDYRYKDKIWEIVDVAPDMENNDFVKIILGVTS
ncbi:phage head-tail adapter protein [Carnobacterium divergens]|uniref:phage head-tail adapter protein n=1 Tax=Carnobacterium divergens TaxID=2748 RepID=UPI0010721BC1|nr:phage head-tail adapter protein [Carnobacterium divergens]TFI67526.1 phage head-tail adapter protein [Carnobacterium divergens]TFI67647.1 phage head-tail adapter protein [Carnobacterium divergens]TFI75548.1 phage head-tail adapter protein [Carnobacterium divergens]TFI82560.1 phage head-tail adapter protein [Carnobacterium divergens]TFI93099.1 phage head-tail adapter protein [Carnobacterium divergens]